MGKITPSSITTCITGGERNVGEGCHKGGSSLQGPVYQPSVPSITEGWRATTSGQTEGAENIHTLQAFQDGRLHPFKKIVEQGDYLRKLDLKYAY